MTPLLAFTLINLPPFTNWLPWSVPFKKAQVPTMEVVRYVTRPLEKVPTV
jgi:hypothetical protein